MMNFRRSQTSRQSTIKIAVTAIGCALAINGILVVILAKLQQTQVKDGKKYKLQDISMTKPNPQLLKLREPEVRKPNKKQRNKPKLIKKRVIKVEQPPIKQVKMQPLALNMNMRLLPLPHLTAVVVPDKVIEEPVDLPEPPVEGPGIYELDMVDKPPQPLVRNAPIYPVAAKRLGVEGWVEVEFIVDETGKVNDVDITNSSSRRFHQSATSAVFSWRFKPALKDQQKVAVVCRQKLKFEIQN